MIPVKVFGEYVVCFSEEPEDRTPRQHFIKECGWTEAEYRKIAKYPFFCAKVTLWKGGKELARNFIGACSYKTVEEFYTKYEGDYFADMVLECAEEVGDENLTEAVNSWRKGLQASYQAFPMQPIVIDGEGIARFKANRIVNDFLEFGTKHGMGMNELAVCRYTDAERMQFAQLIGYSVSGYGDLRYASKESVAAADSIVEGMRGAA